MMVRTETTRCEPWAFRAARRAVKRCSIHAPGRHTRVEHGFVGRDTRLIFSRPLPPTILVPAAPVAHSVPPAAGVSRRVAF
jgi:hypothetical protein